MKSQKVRRALQKNRQAKEYERRQKLINNLGKKFPIVGKFARHPVHSSWLLVGLTILEVGGSLLAAYLLTQLIFALPFPRLTLPTISIPFPDLPTINLPHLPNLPDMPPWLETILHWTKRLLPILIAVMIAIRATAKHQQSKEK